MWACSDCFTAGSPGRVPGPEDGGRAGAAVWAVPAAHPAGGRAGALAQRGLLTLRSRRLRASRGGRRCQEQAGEGGSKGGSERGVGGRGRGARRYGGDAGAAPGGHVRAGAEGGHTGDRGRPGCAPPGPPGEGVRGELGLGRPEARLGGGGGVFPALTAVVSPAAA